MSGFMTRAMSEAGIDPARIASLHAINITTMTQLMAKHDTFQGITPPDATACKALVESLHALGPPAGTELGAWPKDDGDSTVNTQLFQGFIRASRVLLPAALAQAAKEVTIASEKAHSSAAGIAPKAVEETPETVDAEGSAMYRTYESIYDPVGINDRLSYKIIAEVKKNFFAAQPYKAHALADFSLQIHNSHPEHRVVELMGEKFASSKTVAKKVHIGDVPAFMKQIEREAHARAVGGALTIEALNAQAGRTQVEKMRPTSVRAWVEDGEAKSANLYATVAGMLLKKEALTRFIESHPTLTLAGVTAINEKIETSFWEHQLRGCSADEAMFQAVTKEPENVTMAVAESAPAKATDASPAAAQAASAIMDTPKSERKRRADRTPEEEQQAREREIENLKRQVANQKGGGRGRQGGRGRGAAQAYNYTYNPFGPPAQFSAPPPLPATAPGQATRLALRRLSSARAKEPGRRAARRPRRKFRMCQLTSARTTTSNR